MHELARKACTEKVVDCLTLFYANMIELNSVLNRHKGLFCA